MVLRQGMIVDIRLLTVSVLCVQKCSLACHKKCLETLAIQCGHKKLQGRLQLFGIDFAQASRNSADGIPFIIKKCTSEIESRALNIKVNCTGRNFFWDSCLKFATLTNTPPLFIWNVQHYLYLVFWDLRVSIVSMVPNRVLRSFVKPLKMGRTWSNCLNFHLMTSATS